MKISLGIYNLPPNHPIVNLLEEMAHQEVVEEIQVTILEMAEATDVMIRTTNPTKIIRLGKMCMGNHRRKTIVNIDVVMMTMEMVVAAEAPEVLDHISMKTGTWYRK